jgi:hypothetical protein
MISRLVQGIGDLFDLLCDPSSPGQIPGRMKTDPANSDIESHVEEKEGIKKD